MHAVVGTLQGASWPAGFGHFRTVQALLHQDSIVCMLQAATTARQLAEQPEVLMAVSSAAADRSLS